MIQHIELFLPLLILLICAQALAYYFFKKNNMPGALSFIILLPVGLMYAVFGQYHLTYEAFAKKQHEGQIKKVMQELKTPTQVIEKLKARLEKEPNSAQGWYLLGRLLASTGSYHEAYLAFKKAQNLNPQDISTTLNLAEVEIQLNQKLKPETKTLLKTALKANPKEGSILAILAMNAFNQQDYVLAIQYWQRLIEVLPPQSEEAKMITEAIAKARDLNQQRVQP